MWESLLKLLTSTVVSKLLIGMALRNGSSTDSIVHKVVLDAFIVVFEELVEVVFEASESLL